MPLVSVILSTYNGKTEWLSESIKSVLNQSIKDLELIIINDASTNNIENILLKYVNKDIRVKYYKNDINLGLTKSLNKGLELSSGKYIARIDDDDIWSDIDKIKKQILFMEENTSYGICGTSTKLIDEYGKDMEIIHYRKNDNSIRRNILGSNQFTHSSIIIRKNILKEIGGYNDTKYTKYVEDYDLWLRIGRRYKMYNLIDVSTSYRINSNSISNKKSTTQNINALIISLKNIKYYPGKITGIIKHIIIIIIPRNILSKIIKMTNLKKD